MTESVVAMRIAIHDDLEDMQWEQLEVGDTNPEGTGLQHAAADLNAINANQRSVAYSLNSSPKVMDTEDAGVIEAVTCCDMLRLMSGGVGSGRQGGPEAKCAQRLQKPKIRCRIKEARPRIDRSGTA